MIDLTKNKYFKVILAIIIYLLLLFGLDDILIQIPIKIYHYDFYVNTLLELADYNSFFYQNYNSYYYAVNSFYQFFIYTVELLLLLPLFYQLIKTDIEDFIPNKNKYLKIMGISLGIYYVANYAINIIVMMIQLLTHSEATSQNQASIEALLTSYTLESFMLIFPIVIMGPLIEELIFRKAIFTLIKNKILAIILSSLVFGLLHTISYSYTPLDFILVTLPYCVIGVAFCWCYYKTNNVITCYILHAGLNLISFIFILIGGILL